MDKRATKYNLSPEMISWKSSQENISGSQGISGSPVYVSHTSGYWTLYVGVQTAYVGVQTAKRQRKRHAIPKCHAKTGIPYDFLEDLEQRHRVLPFQWNIRTPSFVPHTYPAETSTTIEHRATDDEAILDDWRLSPSKLLSKLQDASISRDELFDAVLFAEVAKFDESQTEQLLPPLFAFVSKYRLSKDEDVMTVVGSAIRKLAMNLPDTQIEQYAELLLPTDTETLPCEMELELAKAILWRLTASPASLSHEFPNLESHLAELALVYLNPRLILQENYASVALQAALGVLLINGQHADSVLQSVKKLGIDWFLNLFQRRLIRLRKELVEIGDATAINAVTNLDRFVSMF